MAMTKATPLATKCPTSDQLQVAEQQLPGSPFTWKKMAKKMGWWWHLLQIIANYY